MRKRITATAVAASALLATAPPALASEETFEFTAAYNWGQQADSGNPVTYTRTGVVAGAWQWRFANGRRGNTHFLAHTFFRSNPNVLIGTITFNMFELEKSAPGSDELYVAYRATSFDSDTGTVDVEGDVIGGKGRYEGVTGRMKWRSTNGFIERGTGTLSLPQRR